MSNGRNDDDRRALTHMKKMLGFLAFVAAGRVITGEVTQPALGLTLAVAWLVGFACYLVWVIRSWRRQRGSR